LTKHQAHTNRKLRHVRRDQPLWFKNEMQHYPKLTQ